MRVATISIYKQATYQLGRLTSDLSEANKAVSTNPDISSVSDDPSGIKQVLTINSDLAALDQYQVNVDQAQNVLTTAETALDAMADQLKEMKFLASSMANASASSQERSNAAESMLVYLDGLMDLANTDAYGGYVFGGDHNQTTPFTYDDDDNPTSVIYNGSSDSVNISISENTTISLDCCGNDLFYEDRIIVDSTNNKIVFSEDAGKGEDNILTIEATITSGTYSKEELAAVVEQTLNEASQEYGYGVVYEVEYDDVANAFSMGTDGSDTAVTATFKNIGTETARVADFKSAGQDFDDVEIQIIDESALTEYTPADGSEPITLTYTEDDTWTISNDPGYGLNASIGANGNTIELDVNDDGENDLVIDLNKTPEIDTSISFNITQAFENTSILTDLGFDSQDVTLSPVTSDRSVAGAVTVVAGENDTIDFTETPIDGEVGHQLTATIEAGTYADAESYAEAVEEALEKASAENGNRVNYSVEYDENTKKFTISEDVDTGRRLESFELLFSSGTNSDTSASSNLGFGDRDVSSGPVTGQEASWSIWDTVLDFKEALEAEDVGGIERAMTRLENHFESITSSMSTLGSIYNTTTTTETTISRSDLTLTTQRSTVLDTDIVEAIMVLKSSQTVYEAALSSTSSVMGLSLVDYMR
ncbi:MAG: flagellar hook-associated protein 3 [Desulfobacterales bacterium]|nr:flagellar hook-associated protein 3 [Desulfobacterales bacterium]